MPQIKNVKNNDFPVSAHCRIGRRRVYENDAARVAAWRERSGKKSMTVSLSVDLLAQLNAFMVRRVDSDNPAETKSEVVERALRYFLRKR